MRRLVDWLQLAHPGSGLRRGNAAGQRAEAGSAVGDIVMAIIIRTEQEAISALTTYWAGCTDALGLVRALEKLGVLHIERPAPAEVLIAQARQWAKPGGAVEVSTEEMARAVNLIVELGKALEVAVAKPSGMCPNQASS